MFNVRKKKLTLEDPVYSGRNTKGLWDYILSHGTGLDAFFDGIDLPKEQILDENEWFDIHTAAKLWQNYRKCLPDFDMTQVSQISFEAFEKSWHGMLKLVTQLSSIKGIIKRMPRLADTISKIDLIKILELTDNSAVIEYSPYPGFEKYIDSSNIFGIQGYLRAIPVIHNQPPANVREVASLIDVFSKFRTDFGQFKHSIEEKQGIVFLDNQRAGKWITVKNDLPLHPAVIKYLSFEKCILWEKDIKEKKRSGQHVIIAEKGDLYNCPKSIFTVRWENASFFSKIMGILPISKQYLLTFLKNRDSLFKQTSLLHDQAKTLKNRVDENAKELTQAHHQILEIEKQILEHRMTQGFALEMETILSRALLELDSALPLDDIKDDAFKLLKNLQQIHEEFNIPENLIAKRFIPQIKKIVETPDQLSEITTEIGDDIERGLRITSQIKTYAGTYELRPGKNRIDLIGLLNTYKKKHQAEFERQQIQLDIFVGSLKDAYLTAEQEHIYSVLSNLINNARDALLEEKTKSSRILVTIEQNQSGFTLTVRDNGPGIPEDQMQKIFTPFFSTKSYSGTGLGLSTAKRYVELYQGHINVESNVGEGTVFHIHFPGESGEYI